MAEEFEKKIICPYCQHEFTDSYEYVPPSLSETEIDCEDCETRFRVTFEQYVEFSTFRLACKADKHVWKEPTLLEKTQEDLDRYKAKGSSLWEPGSKPHCFWLRACENCEKTEYSKKIPLGSPCPWETAHASNKGEGK